MRTTIDRAVKIDQKFIELPMAPPKQRGRGAFYEYVRRISSKRRVRRGRK